MSTDWIIRRIAKRNDRSRRDPIGTYLWAMIITYLLLVAACYGLQYMGWL